MATDNKYDRQLRLWGGSGQKALMEANILLVNASATGTETLKNLVLPGERSPFSKEIGITLCFLVIARSKPPRKINARNKPACFLKRHHMLVLAVTSRLTSCLMSYNMLEPTGPAGEISSALKAGCTMWHVIHVTIARMVTGKLTCRLLLCAAYTAYVPWASPAKALAGVVNVIVLLMLLLTFRQHETRGVYGTLVLRTRRCTVRTVDTAVSALFEHRRSDRSIDRDRDRC